MENRCRACDQPLTSLSASALDEDSSLSGLCETCRSAASEATYSSGPEDGTQSVRSNSHGSDQTSAYVPDGTRQIGHFELTNLLGKGGFGAVWRAFDTNLEREVVVKLPKAVGRDANLRHEAQTAAKLKHPNIVAVYEVGEENGQVYIASELIEGNDLREELSSGRPTIERTVELIATLARAVHHAHEHGVVHRDLKPANIMIDDSGVPYVTDFGMAKQISTEATISSEGQVVGTISYMSPEQARGSSRTTDHRSDIYSLGVMLFEMLTDNRPFRGNARAVLHQKIYEDPPSPRKLAPQLPRDLATICLKCLERDPNARYKSAVAVAEELDRFTRNEPILARPISAPEKLWRWCKRRPAVAGLISGIILTLSFALMGITHFWREAVHQTEQTKRSLYRSEMALAGEYWKSGDITAMQQTLQQYSTDEHLPSRGFEYDYYRHVTAPFGAVANHGDVLTDVAIAHDHAYMASVGNDRAIRVWSTKDGKLLRTLNFSTRCVGIHCSPKDGRLASLHNDGMVRLWNPLQHDREIKQLPAVSGATAMAWSHSGDAIALASRLGAKLFRVSSNEALWESDRFDARVKSIRIALRGEIAVGLQNGSVHLFNPNESDSSDGVILADNKGLEAIAFSDDGSELAIGCFDGSMHIWDLTNKPQEIAHVPMQRGAIGDLEFLAPLDRWASVSVTGNLILSNRDGRAIRTIPTHNLSFGRLALSRDGARLVVGGGDGSIKQLRIDELNQPSVFWFSTHVRDVEFLDNHLLAVCTGDGTIALIEINDNTVTEWSAGSGREMLSLATSGSRPSPLAATGMTRELLLWRDTNDPGSLDTAALPLAGFGAVAISRDEQWLAAASRGGELRVYEMDSLEQPALVMQRDDARINAVAFSYDDQQVFLATSKNRLSIIDLKSQKESLSRDLPAEPLAVAIAKDFLVVGTQSGELLYLNPTTLEVTRRRKAHSSRVNAVAVFPDGKRVVTAGRDQVLRIWDAASGDRLASLPSHTRQIFGVAISPDGKTVASCGLAGDVRLWRSN